MGLQKVTNKVATQNATEAKPDKGVENALKVDNDSLKAVRTAILSSNTLVVKSIDSLSDILLGNDLQKAEDQQEMIEILKGLKPSKEKVSPSSKGIEKTSGLGSTIGTMLGGALGSLVPQLLKDAGSLAKKLIVNSPEILAAGAAISLGIAGGLAKTGAAIGESFQVLTKGTALESFGTTIANGAKASVTAIESFALNVATGLEKIGMKKTANVFLDTFVGASELTANLATKAAIFLPIVQGVVEGVTGFYKGVDEANKKGLKGTDKTLAVMESTLDGFSHGVISGSLLGLLDVAKSAVSQVAHWFGAEDVETFLDSFKITDVIVEAAKMGGEFIGDVIWKVWDGLMGIVEWFQDYGPERMIDSIAAWWRKGDFIKGIKDFFSNTFTKIVGFFTDTVPEVVTAVSDWWKNFKFIESLTSFATAAFSNIKAFFGKLFDSVGEFFTTGWAVAREIEKQITDVLESGIKGIFKIIINTIKFLLDNIPGLSYLLTKIPGFKNVRASLDELSPNEEGSSSRVSDYENQKKKESRLVMLKQERDNLNQLAREHKDAQASAPMVVAIAGGSNSSPSSANVNATSIQVAGSTHREGGLGIFGAVRT